MTREEALQIALKWRAEADSPMIDEDEELVIRDKFDGFAVAFFGVPENFREFMDFIITELRKDA